MNQALREKILAYNRRRLRDRQKGAELQQALQTLLDLLPAPIRAQLPRELRELLARYDIRV